MAKKKKTENEEIVLGSNPVEKYQRPLAIAGIGLIAAAVIFLVYQRFYLEPMQEESVNEMFEAEKWYAKDSFDLALNGNISFLGFADIADEYGLTDAGELAHYYAGVCHLNLALGSDSLVREDHLNSAVEYLRKFNSGSKMLQPIALGACGDAYSDLGEYAEAASYYGKAANADNNEYTTPMYLKKQGLVYEELGDYQKAVKAYQRIKNDFGTTTQGNGIDKYITRAQSKL